MVDKDEGKVNKVEKRPVGRPTRYTEEFGIEICDKLSRGESIRGLRKYFPTLDRSRIREWQAKFPEFQRRYTQALAERTDERFDRIEEIALNGSQDYKVNVDGKVVQVQEVIARSRLAVDALKWICAREQPNKYGDKVAVEHNGSINHEHKITISDDMSAILNRAGVETDMKVISDD